MEIVKVKPVERYLGYLLEVFPMILIVLIPVIGSLLSTAYILFRDAIFNGQSVGKKILKLQVVMLEGHKPASLRESALRNFPLALGFFFPIIPVIGHVIGSGVATIIFVIEAIAIATDKNGRRLGDKIAGTIVIKAQES